MKTSNLPNIALFFVTSILLLSSCSESVNGDRSSDFSMEIDGKTWATTINNLFTEAAEHETLGEYYRVLVGGQRILDTESEGHASSFNMYIIIPKDKFKNPKGTYAIMKESETKLNQASASFVKSGETGQVWYASYDPANPTASVGTVEITDFAIGTQKVVGQSSGVEGYTKLSGTFSMDMYHIQVVPATVMKVTKGMFDLKSGIGFDFQ